MTDKKPQCDGLGVGPSRDTSHRSSAFPDGPVDCSGCDACGHEIVSRLTGAICRWCLIAKFELPIGSCEMRIEENREKANPVLQSDLKEIVKNENAVLDDLAKLEGKTTSTEKPHSEMYPHSFDKKPT